MKTIKDVVLLESEISRLEEIAHNRSEDAKAARAAVNEAVVKLRETIQEISSGQLSLVIDDGKRTSLDA